jgi:hypothetical protein
MNPAWHRKHVMKRNATVVERIAWHRDHQKVCACRPIPAKLLAQMTPNPPGEAIDPRFGPVVAALVREPRVMYGGKGFGSSGLKLDGKLFAMMSSRGQFVAKLPRDRVSELVRTGKGEPFDPGRGRLMKEWVALDGAPSSWVGLAKEAYRFVSGLRSSGQQR